MNTNRITLEQMHAIAAKLGKRDFWDFADQVSAIDPVAGAICGMHAQCTDYNSPDVQDWPQYTIDELAECPATTAGEARDWWLTKYVL